MKRLFPFVIQSVSQYHRARLIGCFLFTISLFFYRSYEHRPVFGYWSYPFFSVLLIATLLCFMTFYFSWRNQKDGWYKNRSKRYIGYFDLAIFFWGVSYFIDTLDHSANAGRVTDMNMFGSVMPIAVLLEWISLVLLLVSVIVFASTFSKTKWINTRVFFTSLMSMMIFFEGLVRSKAIISPETQGVPTYTADIWARYYVRYNKAGFRDAEHELDKVNNQKRLMVVGDSCTFGTGIKCIEDRFGAQVVKILREKTREDWEIINLGEGDTHTLDHIEFLKTGMIYAPDVVILLYVFNDIDYLYPVTPRPSYSFFSLVRIFFQNSYFFQELFIRLRHVKYAYMTQEEDIDAPYRDNALLAQHLADVKNFVTISEKNGAFVRVVPFDRINVSDSIRQRYINFVQTAKSLDIPIWSIANVFNEYPLHELVVNRFDSHPNELANRLMAKEISKRLIEEYLQ